MIAGPILALFWVLVAVVGAMGGLAFVLGMRGAS